jgi:glycolate oxidase FAD binding subunit
LPSASESVAASLKAGPVRVVGAGTRSGWGRPVDAPALETAALKGWEHEPGDFTVVVGAGERLGEVQARLAEAGQMLALDPPGDGTIGGLVATADSGPLRHRYGAPRDLVIGVQLALSDGTLARGGGRVIKNVAGYDLPKLAAGSYGTLGVITEVSLRLHPRPEGFATARFAGLDAAGVQRRSVDLLRRPLEADALDLRWDGSEGEVLVRFSGPAAAERAARVADDVIEDDEDLWREQRARQRGEFVVRVHALPTEIARVLRAVPGATAVGRAGVGTIWLHLTDAAAAGALSAALGPQTALAVLDAPEEARRDDPFGLRDRPERALMQSVKDRFDPENHCNPGLGLP